MNHYSLLVLVGIDLLLSVLSLLESSSLSLSLDQSLSVFGEEKFDDSNIGGLDGDSDDSSLLGLFLNLLNVQAPLLSVDGVDLSTGSLIASSENLNGIFPSNRKSLNAVLFLQLIAQGRTHQSVLDVRWGAEVGLSLFSSLS